MHCLLYLKLHQMHDCIDLQIHLIFWAFYQANMLTKCTVSVLSDKYLCSTISTNVRLINTIDIALHFADPLFASANRCVGELF